MHLPATTLTILATLSSAAAHAGARVIDLEGDARRGREPVALFQSVATRDELVLPAKSSVTLIFDREGRQFVLQGPGRYRIDDAGPAALEGAAPRALGPTANPLRVTMTPGSRLATGATAMRASGATDLAPGPDATRLLDAPAALTWTEVGAGSRYRIQVGTAAGEALHEAVTETARFELPADTPMRRGGSYAWSIDVVGGPRNGARTYAAFTVADEATRAQWAAVQPHAADPVSQWVLYANALEGSGYFADARAAWNHVLAERPGLRLAQGR